MSAWQLSIVLKPLGLLLMFAPGALLVWWIRKRMRPSWLRRVLLISWKV